MLDSGELQMWSMAYWISNALIAFAFFTIPFAIFYIARKRREYGLYGINIAFALFILACGTDHILQIVALRQPMSKFEVIIKGMTALASMGTALGFWMLRERFVAMPSPLQLQRIIHRKTRDLEATVKRLESEAEARSYAEKQLEKASQEKTRFLTTMSHEIRTPLGLVTGYSDLLLNTTRLPKEAQEYVEAIRRSGSLLKAIVDDILDLSKIEAGLFEMRMSDVPLERLIHDMSDMFSLRCEERGLHFETHIDPGVPAFVYADEVRLKQVLVNVVGNAVKFTQTGKVCLRVSRNKGQGVVFEVVDTGKGIRSDKKGSVFREFVQEDGTIKEDYGGTGLGLTLSRKLARLMGGDVDLKETMVGKGSTFTITIEGRKEAGTRSMHDKTNDRLENPPNLAGMKIMVIDDVVDNLTLMRLMLKPTKAEVILMSDPRRALERLKTEAFDLVMLDIQMPDINGFECLERIRSLSHRATVWALTAMSFKEEITRIQKAGFDGYLGKPISIPFLYSKLTSFHGLCDSHAS